MNSKDLLLPRFEVIADYPNSCLEIGTVLKFDGIVYGTGEPQKFERCPQDFPHLFKRLKWFEQRKKEDMPKKLICKAIQGDTDVSEIEEWDMEIMVGWINKEKRVCCSLLTFNYEYGYFPVD